MGSERPKKQPMLAIPGIQHRQIIGVELRHIGLCSLPVRYQSMSESVQRSD